MMHETADSVVPITQHNCAFCQGQYDQDATGVPDNHRGQRSQVHNAALEQARVKLAAVLPPPEDKDMPPIVNGYLEVKFTDGITRKVRWPPNIDVVEGLQKCFDKPYLDAYKEECRGRLRQRRMAAEVWRTNLSVGR